MLVTICLLAAVATAAAPPPWRLAIEGNPLRGASLSVEPAEAASPPPGAWHLALGMAYFNVWSGGWHTRAIHDELGRQGQPLGDDEIEELGRRYPEGPIHRVDVEGQRGELVATRGLPGGLALSVRVPWVKIGRPHWDQVAWDWHNLVQIPQGDRESFPPGGTMFYLHDRGATVVRRDELRSSGVGDVAIALGVPAGRILGGTQRLVAAVELPTGERDGLLGSGGVDVGVRAFSSWEWRSRRLLAAVGYTRLDRGGHLLGLERSDTWHLLVAAEQRLTGATSLRATFTYEASVLRGASRSDLGDASYFSRYGLVRSLPGSGWVAFEVGQDYPGIGVAPDFSFHLVAGVELAR